jgi:hypothetical protein
VQASQAEIYKQRVLTAQRKNEAPAKRPEPTRSEPTWKEKLEEMRNHAIALGFTPPDMQPDPTKR